MKYCDKRDWGHDIVVRDRAEFPQAAVNAQEAPAFRDSTIDVDALYDLAWHLCLNEREAIALVLSALQLWSDFGSRNGSRTTSPSGLLVQTYLKGHRLLLSRFTRSACNLKKRGGKTALSGTEMAFCRLSPEERVCLILRERLGLSVSEIAQITSLSLERTRLALFSARERLLSFVLER